MGAKLTKEHKSTWDQDDVKTWKKKAAEILKTYYLSFRGSQFDEYMVGTDEKLLLAKICFAIYGPPTVANGSDELCDGYEENQKETANEIFNLILKVHKANKNSSKRLLVGIIVVACKQDKSEYSLPIFSVFTGTDGDECKANAPRAFIDTHQRTYDSWNDWLKNNTLPKLKYAFPRHGFFTASESCTYEFDENRDPDIKFGTSPACNLSSRFLGTTDAAAGVTSLACGAIGIASLFTPIGPVVLLTSAISGGSSAIYGASRAAVRLHDKRTHGECLTDLESFTLWFNIAATPLHFASSFVNATLVRGAVVNGRIFSNSMRMFATVLNFSTVGVDGVMIAFGIANMIEKFKRDQLTSVDVLQFSMSVFFFTNTLIRPQIASSIIKNAQEMHIQNYANTMTDAEAQKTFNRFVENNKGAGTITDNSKIIRTINRIGDPNKLFGDLKTASDIKIGGRKGKTLLVPDQNQQMNRINTQNGASTTASIATLPPPDKKHTDVNEECDDLRPPTPPPDDEPANLKEPAMKTSKYSSSKPKGIEAAYQYRVHGEAFPAVLSKTILSICEQESRRAEISAAVNSFRDSLLEEGYAGIEHIKALSDVLERPIVIHYNQGHSKVCGEDYEMKANPVRIQYFPPDENNAHGHYVPFGEDRTWGFDDNNCLFHAIANQVNFTAHELRNAVIAKIDENAESYSEILVRIYNGNDDSSLMLGGALNDSAQPNQQRNQRRNQKRNRRTVLKRRYRMIYELLPDHIDVYPKDLPSQTYAIMRHILNRYIFTWSVIRGLNDILEAQIFKPGGSKFQDVHGGQGPTIHASHVVRAAMNENIQHQFPVHYEFLTELTSITENMIREVNAFYGLGGDIDQLSEFLINNNDYDDYRLWFLFILSKSGDRVKPLSAIGRAITKVEKIISLEGDYVEGKINDLIKTLHDILQEELKKHEN